MSGSENIKSWIKELNNKILELTKSNQEYEIQLKNYKIEFQKLQESSQKKENISKEFQQAIHSFNYI